jgi:uncharacterized protein YutE (UPF0331/DUF86 family)
MIHTDKAAAILRQLAATIPHNSNSLKELRVKAALITAAEALHDYGTELSAREAIAKKYRRKL